jgi:UDP-glucose 4-epimerase
MAILVTGGAGYIGSHTCVELLNAGQDIVLLDNFSNSKVEVVELIRMLAGKRFPVCAVDLLHKEALENVFAAHEIEAVVHFAGLKAVGESVEKPLDYYHNNVTGTLNLCKAMAQAGCKRMVFSSSATVYGENTNVPFKEDYPTAATNPYGMTKLVIERILQDIAAADNDWSVALLRYFNPVGAHSSGLLGEDPNGTPNNLAPYIAQVAAGKLECLNVFGDDYDTKDGTGVRDYLHVVDLAVGHLRALEYTQGHRGAEAINLGTGRGYTVLEMLRAFEKAVGHELKYRICPRRPGDIATCYADTAKAEDLLGWKAQLGLKEMCADAWRFAARHYGVPLEQPEERPFNEKYSKKVWGGA